MPSLFDGLSIYDNRGILAKDSHSFIVINMV